MENNFSTITSDVASLCQQQVHRVPTRRLLCLHQTRPRVIGVIGSNTTAPAPPLPSSGRVLPCDLSVRVDERSAATACEHCQRDVLHCGVNHVLCSSKQSRIVVWSTPSFHGCNYFVSVHCSIIVLSPPRDIQHARVVQAQVLPVANSCRHPVLLTQLLHQTHRESSRTLTRPILHCALHRRIGHHGLGLGVATCYMDSFKDHMSSPL